MAVPISNVTRRVVFSASGTGPYNFTFEILANTDIAVYKDDALLTLTTDYTVTINANGTGSITLTASPTGATQIAIVGNRTIQRTTDFVTGGDFFANTVNDEMDQQTIFAQQNAEGLQRALQAPQTDPTTIDMTLPRASVRANKTLAFDSNGDPTTGEVIGDNRGNWASGTAYNKRDIVRDNSNGNVYYANTAHTSTGSTPISSNTDSAKWDLIVNNAAAGAAQTAAEAAQAAAETAETNAETAETNAETAATAAASSASAASTSATNAASSASTASTAATNAGNSATSAASSASSASSSASSASSSASSASTSASNASTSASNASTSATNAASSASSASSSASTATTQATNAATSATAAASSATSAAASAAAAAASFDAFDDIYLGAKSSDPSVDNDGNALTTGDQYFNTSANELRVYNGSTWQAASTVGGTVTSLSVTGNTTLGDATADSVTVNAGTLNFAQTGQRITGDFSNGTVANRTLVQSSTTNGSTSLAFIPNGTSQFASVALYASSSDPANTSFADLSISGSGNFARIRSHATGTGTVQPLVFDIGNSERMRVDTSGNVGVGTSSPTWKTTVVNGSTPRCLQLSQYATNNIDKYSFISAGHYTSSTYTDGFALIGGVGSSGANAVQIGGGIGETLASSVIQFYTAANNTTTVGTERMRIDSSGNLGIGTSSPSFPLDVAGAIRGNSWIGRANSSAPTADAFVYRPADNSLGFGTANTERMRIDSSGNLGLGVTPSAWATYKAFQVGGGAISEASGTAQFSSNYYRGASSDIYINTNYALLYRQVAGSGQHQWFTAPSGTAGNAISFTQAMTLDSSGNLLVGTTSTSGYKDGRFNVNGYGTFSSPNAGTASVIFNNDAGSGTRFFTNFVIAGSVVGSINSTGTSTTYSTSSDYRLKENISPMTNALAKVAALKPVTYTWKATGETDEGFIAHELQEVCPSAVTGEKDAVDAEGNPQYQGIDTSFLIATLTAAIQEQQAIITALTARVTALESN